MSSESLYYNSSRILSVQNKVKAMKKPDKKEIQKQRKVKARQEANDRSIPQQQNLPNGKKPDFGHSSKEASTRKKNGNTNNIGKLVSSSSHKQAGTSGTSKNIIEGVNNAELLTKNLKELLLTDPKKLKNEGSVQHMLNNAPSEQVMSCKAKGFSPITTPQANYMPLNVMSPQNHNGVMHSAPPPLSGSPMLMHPGLPPPHHNNNVMYTPQTMPSMVPPWINSNHPQYGNNYTLAAPMPPHMMSHPQLSTALPQLHPGLALPIISNKFNEQVPHNFNHQRALELEQLKNTQHHQLHLQYQQSQQNQQNQPISAASIEKQGQQTERPKTKRPQQKQDSQSQSHNNSTTRSNESSKSIFREGHLKKKKGSKKSGQDSNSFAGASFTTSVPNLQNLPKPSFT